MFAYCWIFQRRMPGSPRGLGFSSLPARKPAWPGRRGDACSAALISQGLWATALNWRGLQAVPFRNLRPIWVSGHPLAAPLSQPLSCAACRVGGCKAPWILDLWQGFSAPARALNPLAARVIWFRPPPCSRLDPAPVPHPALCPVPCPRLSPALSRSARRRRGAA